MMRILSSRRVLPAGLFTAAVFTLALAPFAAPADVVSLGVPGRANDNPSVAASGSFVAVAWGGASGGRTDVFVAVSRDAGRTFAAPAQVNQAGGEARLGGEMPPRVALVPRAGQDPQITVLWTARAGTTQIKTAVSRDGGRSYEASVALQSAGAAGDRGWPALALDKSGNAHAIWLDHRGLAADRAKSGRAAGHQPGAAHDGFAMAQKSGLFYASTAPGRAGDRQLTAGVCYCCKTALAAGADGALYAAWRHVYPGSVRDMAFTMSRDGGATFSPLVRVHQDGWNIDGCPDDGPAMAVTGTTVHLVWPTVVSTPRPEGALFYASTRDGKVFGRATRIPTLGSPKPSHPQIVAGARGRMVVAWDEYREGRNVAVARELTLDGSGHATFGPPTILSPDAPSVYPVMADTSRGIVAVWATGGDGSAIKVRALP